MGKKSALAMVEHEPNDRAVIGGNNPPAELTPFDKVKKRIDDLVDEARLYCDGAKIETQELCDDFSNLQRMIGDAAKEAEDLRKVEAKPFDDGKAEVQGRYNPLIGESKTAPGSAFRAIAALKAAQQPFLVAKKAALEAEQKRLRDEAAAKELAAREALRASSPENLAEREAAEQLVQEAKAAKLDANRAERTTAKAGGTFGRATGLHTVYRATMTDPRVALNYYAANRRDDLVAWLQSMADAHIRFGQHTEDEIPGFKIHSEQVVR